MIAHLLALIAKAEKEIEELKIKIKEAEEELAICYELKPILTRITNNSLSGYNSLQSAGNNLNNGIKIAGIGQGEKILERANKIQELNSKSSIAEANVEKRIKELEENIKMWNQRIEELNANIAGWRAEIARLQEEAKKNEAAG